MTHPPVLFLPDFTKEFVIKCDASGVGIGIVLMQNIQQFAFLCHTLKGRNLLLFTYEKEMLALAVPVKKKSRYLLGSTFIIQTDHHNLKYLLEKKVGTPAQ